MKVETGVDRLHALLQREKSITLVKAVQELNVPKEVILDWADVLEQQGDIVVKYGFFSMTFTLKDYNPGDLKKRISEFSIKKEGFSRKVESALKNMEDQGASFSSFKDSFDQLKKEVGGEITMLRKELGELDQLEQERHRLTALAKTSPEAMTILQEAGKHEQAAGKLRDEILGKVSGTRISEEEKRRIMDKFRAFFDKKNDAGKMVSQIETEYAEMEAAYKRLFDEAGRLDPKEKGMAAEVDRMEQQLAKLKAAKQKMVDEIGELNRMMVDRK